MKVEMAGRTVELLNTLKAQADAQNMALDDYLGLFAEAGTLGPANGNLSLDELDQLLDELSSGLPPLTSLPTDFSRSDLYVDHD